jgi:hypothetical protein
VLRLTIPSKLFDYMLAARPIVAGIVGEGKAILESTGANICYAPESPPALREALCRSFVEYDRLAFLAAGNRALVLERFTREQAAANLLDIFESVSPRSD